MNALTEWKPCRQLKKLRILGRMFGLKPARTTNGAKESIRIAKGATSVDFIEGDKEWLVKAGLPEVKKENVKVVVENGVLTIAGGSKFEKEKKDKKHHRSERTCGNFLRSFTLPEGADGSKLDAEFKDGVLTVHLPKSENTKPLGDEGEQQRSRQIDRLVKKYTTFGSMEDLLNAEGIYRPSLYLPFGERWLRHEVNLVADEYNRRQEARGDPRRAFRLRANADSTPPDL
jgi:HSP20 family protein